jgi:ribosomal protein S27AE
VSTDATSCHIAKVAERTKGPSEMEMKNGGMTDYTRVCKRCGDQWLLLEVYAKDKGPSARQRASMQKARKFALGRQRERHSMQAAALQSQQDRFVTNATCPQCGSTDFDQYGPGEAPTSTLTVGVAAPPQPTVPATQARWGPDPYGRHELRFWDGQAWAAAVVDDGVPGIDQAT